MNTKRHILSVLALSCSALLAQEAGGQTKDPFAPEAEKAPVEQAPGDENQDGPKQVSLRFETFSLESADAAAMLRAGLEGKALYEKLIQKVEKKEVTQECLIVLRARSGEKALVEGISEQIYPTEYEPPYTPPSRPTPPAPAPNATPAAIAAAAAAAAQPENSMPSGSAPACPTSFETRNVGWTFEVEPTIGANNKVVDLRFAPNRTVKGPNSIHGQGLSKTEMPTFETQRINAAITVNANVPFFIGTFNRTPEAQIDPATAKRVWFAFITPTIVSADCTVLGK
ncbi:MAG: hypothetical protein JWO82_433 [Akkermansiaceae bacterium]|nr:hypothetical protein [Akkermansiaceae bacterium]